MTLLSSVLHGDSIASVQQSMQTLLDCVRKWSLSHRLSINVSKCFALYISGTRTTYSGNLPLYTDGKPISVVDKLEILGVFYGRFKMALTSL